jgi:uncharacterized protein (DUF736 family)
MKIGSLWKKVPEKGGEPFLSGVIEYPGMTMHIAVFKVKEKKSAKAPDYEIVWNNGKGKGGTPKQGDGADDIPF